MFDKFHFDKLLRVIFPRIDSIYLVVKFPATRRRIYAYDAWVEATYAYRPSECDDLGLLKDLGEHVPGGLALQVHEDVRRVIPAVDFEPDIQHCLDRDNKNACSDTKMIFFLRIICMLSIFANFALFSS